MKNNYTSHVDNDLKTLYNEIDYNYDEMLDKDVNKELVNLYTELSDEMTFNYDDGPDNVAKRKNAAKSVSNEDEPKKRAGKKATKKKKTTPYYYEETSMPDNKPVKKESPKKDGAKEPLSKTKKVVLGIILTIAVGIFLISGLKLLSIKKAYDDGRNAYEKIDKDFFKGDTDNIDELDWDFTELFSQNPDVVGYIYSPGLVSYPVVQGSDNSYYLRHLFTHEYNDSGSIFLDCNLPNKFESRNCIIYGHNMKDGSMFSKLVNFCKEDGSQFYQDHKEFHIFTTDGHHYVYKVFGAYTARVTSNLYAIDLNDEQFLALLNEIKANTAYDTDPVELGVGSKIITLSTCLDNSDYNYRQVVLLVRDREIIKNETTEQKETPSITIDE